MNYRISIDLGGTFTDAIVVASDGRRIIGKALTTHDRAFKGMSAAIANAAEQNGLTLRVLLENTGLFIYGTTRATNAIVTRRVAKTAFLTTSGFPDILVMKEGGKLSAHDFSHDFPAPYIARRDTFEIRERMNSEGTPSLEFDEKDARRVAKQLKSLGFEAVAVCFLWSIANPAHELAMAKILDEELPDVPYTLSHDINPVLREYRRASAAAIDASLKPLMQRHLRDLEGDLRDAGYVGEILVSTSIGGVMLIDEVCSRPIHMAKSGPSMAPISAKAFSMVEGGTGEAIVCDTGGTTFDVGLVRGGEQVYSRESWIGGQWVGDLLGISSVDIRSLGAGGGSIVWVDDGGLMRVGPQSAGSSPGPACYGLGGTEPTVSDAACVLGYFDPQYFLGGRMQLNTEAARNAIGKIASTICKSIEVTAFDILTLASELMVKAIHDITVAQGFDPAESVIVAGGGAAGINTMLIAKQLSARRVVLPKEASALSACGMQFADIVREEAASCFMSSDKFDSARINGVLANMKSKLTAFLSRLALAEKFRGNSNIAYYAEARYASQVWELEMPLPSGQLSGAGDLKAFVEAFHRAHETVFGVRDEGSAVEFITWKARLRSAIGIQLEKKPEIDTWHGAPVDETRLCYFGAETPVRTPIYRGGNLRPGMILRGPCVVEEPTTTLVVFPKMFASVSGAGNYLLSFDYAAG
jgi:N-methylhydantoinase A